MKLGLLSTFFFALLWSVSVADGHLRGRKDIEVSTYRLLVFEDLLRLEDGSFTSLDRLMAIPVVDGRETATILSIDISAEFLAENIAAVEAIGEVYISVTGASVQNDVLVISDEAQYTVLDEIPFPRRQRHLGSTGTRTVAVLRVGLSSGAQVDYSAAVIHQHMFTKPVSLARQMERCTNGDLVLQSAGVFEVTVEGNIDDFTSPSELRNTALAVFANDQGIAEANAIADHVIVILPKNDFPGFVGNAATGGWISTLNNHWSLDVMVYMHEIGHNLGLGHAYLTDNSPDYSSYMSATGWEPNLEGPLKCYNAASNRQLGWFVGHTRSLDMYNDPTQSITLAAFSEVDDKKQTRNPAIVTVGEYSLQYNFASGFNNGTELLRDVVTIAYSVPGKTFVEKEGLGPDGNVFSVDDFGGSGQTLQIEACDKIVGDSQSPNAMTIALTLGKSGSPCATLFGTTSVSTPTVPCPDTSQEVVVFKWGSGIMSVQCEWIDEQPSRQEFCDGNSFGGAPGSEKVFHICQQECSSYANCKRGKSID